VFTASSGATYGAGGGGAAVYFSSVSGTGIGVAGRGYQGVVIIRVPV
jgi:hypothetical protein